MEGLAELLEMLMPFLEDLARTVESAAPVVWQIMLWKVVAEGVQFIVWGILGLAFFFSASRELRRESAKEKPSGDYATFLFIAKWIAAALTSLMCTLATSRFIATDYYVLLRFVQLLRGSSGGL